ncbi:MAG: hypothetical protein LBL70_06940 [Treponema sp.]|jgi:hypothetical protein|nr:hypothetical protein [Treponema sp.]
MFNPKISGIFAGAGFVLSFLVGLLSGARFPLLLIRACIFAAVFFALSGAFYAAIQRYLPELLPGDSRDIPSLGGQVDISVGGDEDAVDGISLESGNPGGDLDEFSEKGGDSGGDTLDQIDEAVYTGEGYVEENQEPPKPALPGELNFSSGEAETVDMLPDLDAMSGAFNSGTLGDRETAADSPASSLGAPGSPARASNKKGLDEDFNVQEMASAIQTILKRENKG